MAFENSNEFTDWLYNRFVEASRKDNIVKAFIFLDVLRVYTEMVLHARKYSRQRRHAKGLLKSIEVSFKDKTTAKLLLTGIEGKQEFEKAMADYERMLIDLGYSRELIDDRLIDKRFNYGR